jgi:hypothetical protein
MLRIAVLRKETGAIDLAIIACDSIVRDNFGDSIKANALCLKGLLHEMRSEFPASEVVYRSALQILAGHSIALERLGRESGRLALCVPFLYPTSHVLQEAGSIRFMYIYREANFVAF